PGEDEVCDGIDNNCDGSTGFTDADGDGFAACEECNDANGNANPGELEQCDAANVDEDCDGGGDDADPQGASSGEISSFPDADLDGFGRTGAAATQVCDIVPGISANDDDCNDTAAAINPDALEVCDAADVDEDCTGTADDGDPGAVGMNTFYQDADADGFGDAGRPPVLQCDVEPGLSEDDTDCDDALAFVNPDAPEICDAVDRDEDCDALADDDDLQGPEGNATTFYDDADADGFGLDASAREGCDAQGNEVATGGDCDDADAGVNPGESEVCDPADTDEDCDLGADDADPEGAIGTSTFFPDDDSDGFGDETAAGREGCQATGAEVADSSDCNDDSAEAFPGALEQCNGQQDNCSVAWTSDDGLVTSEGPGGATDQTAAFNAGSSGAPAAVALPAGDTVTVCPGTYFVALTGGGTTDVEGFTGVAGDVVLSGGGVDRVLTLSAGGVVSLTDLTVAEGSAINGGGALVGANDLTTDGVVFDGNTASGSGGAVSVGTGNATFTDTTFTGNTADLGGAVSVDGGIVTGSGGTLTANDATSGGGWYVTGGGLLDLTNVATSANNATTGGGGYVADGTVECSGVSGSFMDNEATVTGGGLELVAGSIVSSACDWALGNLPDDVHTPVGSYFYGLNATFTCDPVMGCVP
ncbi:MAG: putative metal-binding motif-containing protein, partial [Deltaproteobacteria bacterium]|nr:putative metal-binding motif-containing protein [Deltaproteobacteria bacterium]